MIGEGWNRVAQYHYLHHTMATLRLRWQRVGPLRSCVVGQGDLGMEAARYSADEYCGPLLEFRFNADLWSYSLTYPGRPDVIPVALVPDLAALGLRLYYDDSVEIRKDMRTLATWGKKHGYAEENGVWREVTE